MSPSKLFLGALFLLTVSACSDPFDDTNDAEPIDWKGNYQVEGVWDLSSPFNSERSFGDAFAELLVGQIVSKAGVPSAATEEAEELVFDLIGAKIKTGVDDNAPEHLKPGSPLMNDLTEKFRAVRVVSQVSLGEGSLLDDVGGTEKILSFEFSDGTQTQVLTPDVLAAEGVPDFRIEADWEGTDDNNVLAIDNHPFELRFGDMVSWVMINLLTGHNSADLEAAAVGAIGCPALLATIAGDDGGFFVEVGGENYGLEATALSGACDAAIGKVSERAVGFFSLDAKVNAGGRVQVLDDDGDGKADRLLSQDDFGGYIGIAPEAIAPRLGVTFEATRLVD